MELQEMNDQFDVWFNNITSNQAPGLDTYEKSVFLTKAQDEILKAYFNPKGNKVLDGFDDSQRRNIDFSRVLRVREYTPSKSATTAGQMSQGDSKGTLDFADTLTKARFSPHENAASAVLHDDILMIVNEQLIVSRSNGAVSNKIIPLQVVPISYNEYLRLMSKPFKRPLQYQAWKVLNGTDNVHTVDLIPGASDTITKYLLRYVKKPKPIILENLEGVTIDNEWQASKCELDSILHQEIVWRACELAKASYDGTLASAVQIGNSSSTEIGIVSGGGSKS